MWLKVSDNFHDHPKVVAAGNAAIGLWVRGGSYSAAYDLDGFVPSAWVRSSGAHYTAHRALVRVGMWLPSGDGWTMHDYHDYNPFAAEWRERADRDAQRKREFRQRARANGGTS